MVLTTFKFKLFFDYRIGYQIKINISFKTISIYRKTKNTKFEYRLSKVNFHPLYE